MTKYYNTNGITTQKPNTSFWVSEWNNNFSFSRGDNTTDLDFKLISLNHKFADQIFGSIQNFYSKLPYLTTAHSYGGMDAEIKVSKTQFEKWVDNERSEETHKILYYYDLQSLTGSLQNLIQESRYLLYNFYKTLNENSFLIAKNPMKPNMVMFASGRIVTDIFAKINHLFINLSSQLDFIAKIAYEFERLPDDYTYYPRLKSKKFLYGDFKKIRTIDFSQTIFEKDKTIKLILSLRNEIVHNASFENIPKVYQVFKDNQLIEKFILIPDSTNGILDSYKNRNRFFSSEVKLNEELPDLVTGFWKRMEATIDKINTAANNIKNNAQTCL